MRLFMEFMQFIEEHPDEGKKDPRYTQIQWELMNPIPADLPDPSTQVGWGCGCTRWFARLDISKSLRILYMHMRTRLRSCGQSRRTRPSAAS